MNAAERRGFEAVEDARDCRSPPFVAAERARFTPTPQALLMRSAIIQ
jgi:hypothetical protein